MVTDFKCNRIFKWIPQTKILKVSPHTASSLFNIRWLIFPKSSFVYLSKLILIFSKKIKIYLVAKKKVLMFEIKFSARKKKGSCHISLIIKVNVLKNVKQRIAISKYFWYILDESVYNTHYRKISFGAYFKLT